MHGSGAQCWFFLCVVFIMEDGFANYDITKMLQKPKHFDGKESNWLEWKFQILNWLCVMDPKADEVMGQAEKCTRTIRVEIGSDGKETDVSRKLNSFIYGLFGSIVSGKALRILRAVPNRCGLEVWRQLCLEYEVKDSGKFLAWMMNLLQADLMKGGEEKFQENWLKWETELEEYERQSGKVMDHQLKLGVLLSKTPDKVKEHLQLNSKDYNTYAQAKSVVDDYLKSKRTWDQNQDGGAQPMQVDGVFWNTWMHGAQPPVKGKGKDKGGKGKGSGKEGKGKGKGKGKDKGKSQDKGQQKGNKTTTYQANPQQNQGRPYNPDADKTCYHCNKTGHRSANCWWNPNSTANQRSNRMDVGSVTSAVPSSAGGFMLQQMLQQQQQQQPQQYQLSPTTTTMSTTGSVSSASQVMAPQGQNVYYLQPMVQQVGVQPMMNHQQVPQTQQYMHGQTMLMQPSPPLDTVPESHNNYHIYMVTTKTEQTPKEVAEVNLVRKGRTRMGMDSGSALHIIPPHYLSTTLRPTADPGAVAANGTSITVYGKQELTMKVRDAARPVSMSCTVADVKRPLASVMQMCKADYRVIFDLEDPHIINKHTKERINLEVIDGMFELVGDELLGDMHMMPPPLVMPVTTSPKPFSEEYEPEQGDNKADTPQTIPLPVKPSAAEVRQHNLTHTPHQSWCTICTHSRGRSDRHLKAPEGHHEGADNRTLYQVDYSYLKSGQDQDKDAAGGYEIKVLNFWNNKSHGGHSTPLENKGVTDYAINWAVNLLLRAGDADVIIQHDPEPSLVALMEKVKRSEELQGKVSVTLRATPKGSHQSNGGVEGYGGKLAEQTRALRMQLEARGVVLGSGNEIMSWVIRHASWILYRFGGVRGMSPFYKQHGHLYTDAVLEFGEKVNCLTYEGPRSVKLQDRWIDGFWLGRSEYNNAHLVLIDNEVQSFRTIRRKAEDEGWGECNINALTNATALPWMAKGKERDVKRKRFAMPLQVPAAQAEGEAASSSGSQPPQVPGDPTGWEKTPGCSGCNQRPGGGFRHSLECKKRREEWMVKKVLQQNPETKAKVSSPRKESKDKKDDDMGQQEDSGEGIQQEDVEMEQQDDMQQQIPVALRPRVRLTGKRELQDHERLTESEAAARRQRVQSIITTMIQQVQDISSEEMDFSDLVTDEILETESEEYHITDKERAMSKLEEIRALESMGVVTPVKPLPGDTIIGSRWVETVKKKEKGYKVKNRLVATEVAWTKAGSELFAPTPSSTTLKVFLATSATEWLEARKSGKDFSMCIADISRAFLHAPMPHRKIIRAPPEVKGPAGETVYWKAEKALYGLRSAPACWANFLRQELQRIGFKSCLSDVTLYSIPGTNVKLMHHVDDIITSGSAVRVDLYMKQIQNTFTVDKAPTYLEKSGDIGKLLGKDIMLTENGIKMFTDAKHATAVIKALNLESCKPNKCPGSKLSKKESEQLQELLGPEEHSEYRSLVGKLIYSSLDRTDVKFTIKYLSQGLSSPTKEHQHHLKVLARYLVGREVAELRFEPSPKDLLEQNLVICYCDSDWAGNPVTRKSTSGGLVQWCGMPVSSWCRGQATIAQSSAEAELYAGNTGLSESMFVKSLLQEIGKPIDIIKLRTDSNAFIGFSEKPGLGTMKHIEIKQLVIQEAVRAGLLKLEKEPTATNKADLMTKWLSPERVTYLMNLGNCFTYPGGESIRVSNISTKKINKGVLIATMFSLMKQAEGTEVNVSESEEEFLWENYFQENYIIICKIIFTLGVIWGAVMMIAYYKMCGMISTWRRRRAVTEQETQTDQDNRQIGQGHRQVTAAVFPQEVFVSKAGTHYHLRRNCPGLNNAAEKRRQEKCGHCGTTD